MITTSFDPEADALYVRFAQHGQAVAETREAEPGIMLDLDGAGNLIGIEALAVSKRSAISAPQAA